MAESFNIRQTTALLHLSFWALYCIYRFFDLQAFAGPDTWIFVGVPVFFYALASYTHYFLILPLWINKKKIMSYLLLTVLLIVLIVICRLFVEQKIFSRIKPEIDFFRRVGIMNVVNATWNVSSFLLFTGMIRFTIDRFYLDSKRKQLENEKLIAELNYLKAQINPHFLFNTLHNLNYLVYSGSKNATEVIIKLSNIMRYMIYDASKEKVLLTKELDYIKDYIHLETIRLNNAFKLDFEISGEIAQIEIAPLILITLVENSFKHGVKDSVANCRIHLKLRVFDSTVIFETENKKIKSPVAEASGFGLSNLKKRLSLCYPSSHTLEIRETDEIYKITLTITRP